MLLLVVTSSTEEHENIKELELLTMEQLVLTELLLLVALKMGHSKRIKSCLYKAQVQQN